MREICHSYFESPFREISYSSGQSIQYICCSIHRFNTLDGFVRDICQSALSCVQRISHSDTHAQLEALMGFLPRRNRDPQSATGMGSNKGRSWEIVLIGFVNNAKWLRLLLWTSCRDEIAIHIQMILQQVDWNITLKPIIQYLYCLPFITLYDIFLIILSDHLNFSHELLRSDYHVDATHKSNKGLYI